MDAVDPGVAGSFWSKVLGLDLELLDDGDCRLSGPTPGHTIWIDAVPEPRAVKNRVHLDVHGSSVERLVALGATVLDDTSFRWIVMADPEGAEFCLFVRDDVPAYRLYELSVDARDHRAMATWWADVIGGTVGRDDDGDVSWIEAVPGVPFDAIVFAEVPEPKTHKNRVHLDLVAADVEPLLRAGAAMLRPPDRDIAWHVLADPEGNEFCVFGRP